MLLERNKRYFKVYDIIVGAKMRKSRPLPMVGQVSSGAMSIYKILKASLGRELATSKSDHDTIELARCDLDENGNIVLLFHRDAFNAQDPSYRAKTETGEITLSKYKKKPHENQALSAHLVISGKKKDAGYRAALEEVPGLNISSVQFLLRQIFQNSPYDFKHPSTGKPASTHATFRAFGLKSENFKNSLLKSRWSSVTLTKPANDLLTDGVAGVKAKPQKIELKISADLPPSEYFKTLEKLVKKAGEDHWDGFLVDLRFPEDDRKKSVAVDREDLGKEILFVRSHLRELPIDLDNCSKEIVPEVVEAAVSTFSGKR